MKLRSAPMMIAVAFLLLTLPKLCTAQSITSCSADGRERKYCPVDTRGGVRMAHEYSDAACVQGNTWGVDDSGIWVSNNCRADFEVQKLSVGSDAAENWRCESNDGQRNFCPVDTRAGVRMTRQLGSAECRQGSTWGIETTGIWVANGCRAEFEVKHPTYQPVSAQNFRCESNDHKMKFCPVDAHSGIRFVRQLGNADCTLGSSWGYDRSGVWVDNGCQAEFEILPLYKAPPPVEAPSSRNLRCAATNNERIYCEADTRGGVRLIRQLSHNQCTQNSTWGYDDRGVWVSGRCGADFEIMSAGRETDRDRRMPGTATTYITIYSGTEISVVTNENIDSRSAIEGQRYSASVAVDILDRNGNILIPRGAEVQLAIRSASGPGANDNDRAELVIDIDNLSVAGRRYRLSTNDLEATSGGDGLGVNRKSAEMIGGGAGIGAVFGAIIGHGKGAAIGAAIGAAAGATATVLTRGRSVQIPVESVLDFRLDRDLRLLDDPQP